MTYFMSLFHVYISHIVLFEALNSGKFSQHYDDNAQLDLCNEPKPCFQTWLLFPTNIESFRQSLMDIHM